MTATNHALTGALIGLLVHNPWAAIPAAIASHYVCDAIPHFDSSQSSSSYLKTKRFKVMLTVDAILCVILVALLAISHPAYWLLASITAFSATLPDALWLNQFIKAQAGKIWKPGLLSQFGIKIQWFAKPIGGLVELAWFTGASILLWQFL